MHCVVTTATLTMTVTTTTLATTATTAITSTTTTTGHFLRYSPVLLRESVRAR
jgi:hypothetical protein